MDKTMGLIRESELLEIELMIQKSRLDRHSEKINSYPVANHPCADSTRIDCDGVLQIFADDTSVITPLSSRSVKYFHEHFWDYRTQDGRYKFTGKTELALTSDSNFSYRALDDNGYPI